MIDLEDVLEVILKMTRGIGETENRGFPKDQDHRVFQNLTHNFIINSY